MGELIAIVDYLYFAHNFLLFIRISFICGLFIGAIAGSAVGFLYAPESGEQTRQKIKESTQEYLNGVTSHFDSYGSDFKTAVEDITSGVKTKIEDYRDQIESKIQEVQNEVNADIAELNEELEQLHNEEEIQRQNLDTLASETEKHD